MLWKYYKNIVNATLFLKFLPRFRQQNFFFPPIFGNDIAIIPFKFFFFFIFGNAIATITKKKKNFFIFLFWQWHRRNCFFLAHRTQEGQEFGQRNFGNSVAEIPLLSLSTFFSFSLLFLLNFGNTVAEILSLSSIFQLTSNSTYKTN